MTQPSDSPDKRNVAWSAYLPRTGARPTHGMDLERGVTGVVHADSRAAELAAARRRLLDAMPQGAGTIKFVPAAGTCRVHAGWLTHPVASGRSCADMAFISPHDAIGLAAQRALEDLERRGEAAGPADNGVGRARAPAAAAAAELLSLVRERIPTYDQLAAQLPQLATVRCDSLARFRRRS